MPTVLSHPAVPLALGIGLGRKIVSRRLLLAGIAVSILPDLDVIAFRYGIAYAAEFGHRGMTHSLSFAFGIAVLGALLSGYLQSTHRFTFFYLFVCAASHGILDAFTNGGLGIALFWPFSMDRYFAPIQMIEVSPLSLSRFISLLGVEVLESELLWVWIPCVLFALSLRAADAVLSKYQRFPNQD